MKTLLHQLLTIVTSLVLALPPGVCCVSRCANGEKAAPVKKASCCHKSAGSVAKNTCPQKSPIRPVLTCCYERDAVAPSKVALAPVHDLLTLSLVGHLTEVPQLSILSEQELRSRIDPGRSLQILLCVWRC